MTGKSTKPRTPDPRPARTREALSAALYDLIQTTRWEKISVQDILDHTGVGRSTFYAHFDNKFDLLTSAIPDTVLPITATDGEQPDLLPLFEHVEEMQPILLPLMSQPLLSQINASFHEQMVVSWVEYLSPIAASPEQADFAAEILAGAFMAVCLRWLKAGCDRPAADVCDDFHRHTAAIISAAS